MLLKFPDNGSIQKNYGTTRHIDHKSYCNIDSQESKILQKKLIDRLAFRITIGIITIGISEIVIQLIKFHHRQKFFKECIQHFESTHGKLVQPKSDFRAFIIDNSTLPIQDICQHYSAHNKIGSMDYITFKSISHGTY